MRKPAGSKRFPEKYVVFSRTLLICKASDCHPKVGYEAFGGVRCFVPCTP